MEADLSSWKFGDGVAGGEPRGGSEEQSFCCSSAQDLLLRTARGFALTGMVRETTHQKLKIPPWQWIAIGVGLALFGLLTRGSFEPFSVLAFILAGGFERLLGTRRHSNWLSIGCGLLVALGVKFLLVDFKVVKSDSLAPGMRKNARVFYRPAFFTVQQGDRVLVKQRDSDSTGRTYLGRIGKMIDSDTYEMVRIAGDEVVVVKRREIVGKVIGVANPPE